MNISNSSLILSSFGAVRDSGASMGVRSIPCGHPETLRPRRWTCRPRAGKGEKGGNERKGWEGEEEEIAKSRGRRARNEKGLEGGPSDGRGEGGRGQLRRRGRGCREGSAERSGGSDGPGATAAGRGGWYCCLAWGWCGGGRNKRRLATSPGAGEASTRKAGSGSFGPGGCWGSGMDNNHTTGKGLETMPIPETPAAFFPCLLRCLQQPEALKGVLNRGLLCSPRGPTPRAPSPSSASQPPPASASTPPLLPCLTRCICLPRPL